MAKSDQQVGPQAIETPTSAAAATTTLMDAVDLAKDIGKPLGRFPMEKPASNRRQKAILLQRRKARLLAEHEYRKRRTKAMHGHYDELIESNKLNTLPRFTPEEIYCGDKLGNGAFGSVYEVKRIVLQKDTTDSSISNNDTNQAARSFMAQHCLRDSSDRGRMVTIRKSLSNRSIDRRSASNRSIDTKNSDGEDNNSGLDSRYAIKRLRSKIIVGDRTMFAQAMIDVATETRILASIPPHPNVIKLRGLAYSEGSSGESFPSCCFHEDFFLVLDRLYGTLDDRLSQWIQQDSQRSIGKMLNWSKHRTRNAQERLVACLDLASALAHLHKHNIIHRDIKPPNIGFNIRGDLTVFDFGLSRELPHDGKSDKNKANSKLFRLTGFCGSPRYMAPEVGLRKVYNAKCDVYSFGLLAWQILTLQKPFEGCDINDLKYVIWPAAKGIIGPEDWMRKRAKSTNGKAKRYSDTYVMSKPQPRIRNPKKSIFDSFKSNKVKSSEESQDKVMKMIRRTFRRNIAARPTMKDLEEFLQKECNISSTANTMDASEQGEERSQMVFRDHSRRRSTFVFQPEKAKQEGRRARRSSMPSTRQKVRRRSHEDSTHHGTDLMGQCSESSSVDDELVPVQ